MLHLYFCPVYDAKHKRVSSMLLRELLKVELYVNFLCKRTPDKSEQSLDEDDEKPCFMLIKSLFSEAVNN